MRGKDHSQTTALCASLIAHGLGLSALAWWYVWHNKVPNLPPIDKLQAIVDHMTYTPPRPVVTPPTPPPPEPAKKKPKPLEKQPIPEDNQRDDSGEPNGHGDANRSTDGKQPMQADLGHPQADLMKPAEHFNKDAVLPASKGKPRGDSAGEPKSTKVGVFNPDVVAEANPLSDPHVTATVKSAPAPGVGPMPAVATPPAPAPVPTGARKPDPSKTQDRIPDDEAKEILGHQATVSDTESMALSQTNGGVFRAGQMLARKGLTVKVKNAALSDTAWYYAAENNDPATLFTVKVDADGNVLGEPEVSKSSGNSYLDHDRLLSLYSWTLMPRKDKDGHVIDDIWVIAYE
jgi:hypothetical protein